MLFYLLALLPVAVLGRQPDNFVIGGSDAAEGAWPWQLSLRGVGGSHSCGASLIGAQKAVCAAHCVGNGPSTYTILAGTNQRSCSDDAICPSRRLTGADRHPDYVDNGNVGYPNDISLLTWLNPITPVVGKIQYVALATGTNQVGLSCFITGWGRTSATGALPENLQEARIDILTTTECQGYWSANQVSDNHVCIFDKTNQARGACNGDSGGPLVCQTTGPLGRWELVGATSWGRTGCSPASPSVYTRISSYVSWINGGL